jgi:hypothetical protein
VSTASWLEILFFLGLLALSTPILGHPRYFITEPGSGLRFVPQGAGTKLG